MKTESSKETRGRKALPDSKKRNRRVIYVTDAEWQEFIAPALEKMNKKRERGTK